MKTISAIACLGWLLLLAPLGALAQGELHPSSELSRVLFRALQRAGVHASCPNGHGCEIAAADVLCTVSNVRGDSYHCSFSLDGIGEKENVAKNPKSRALFNALEGAGLTSDCGAGTCGVEAKPVRCTRTAPAGQPSTYACVLGR